MEKIQQCFCIDLERSKPEVMEYSGQVLKNDMAYFKANTPLDLDSFDWRVFLSESQAETFLEKYLKVLKNLDNDKICHSRKLPAMLYKRRYIVLTLLGLKLKTVRHYKKDWKPGQLFNLNDQTFFLTVRLKKITPLPNGEFKYEFTLP
jgi:hypothetical protein